MSRRCWCRRQTPPGRTTHGPELDFGRLVESQSVECAPEVMEAERSSTILYQQHHRKPKGGPLHVHGTWSGRTIISRRSGISGMRTCSSVPPDIGWVVRHSYIVYAPHGWLAPPRFFREGAPDAPNPGVIWSIVERSGVSVMFPAPTAVRMFMRYGPEYPPEVQSQKPAVSHLRWRVGDLRSGAGRISISSGPVPGAM